MTTKYYRHPEFGQVYGERLLTPIVRMVWPQLVTPKAGKVTEKNPNPPLKYQITFMLDKDAGTTKAFLAEAKKMTDEMLVIFNEKRKTGKLADIGVLRDGDDTDYYKADKYPYYKNQWLIAATNKDRILTVGPKKETLDPSAFIGGMLVRGVVVPMITPTGLSWRCEMVQLAKDDGTRIGATRPEAGSLLEEINSDEAPFEGGTLIAAADKAIGASQAVPQVSVQTVMPDGKKKALDLL